jgi:hypothetical protein
MDNHKIVVAVLILAIVFSVVATLVSLSILDFKPVFVENKNSIQSSDGGSGGISLRVDPYVPSESEVLQ